MNVAGGLEAILKVGLMSLMLKGMFPVDCFSIRSICILVCQLQRQE